VALVDADDVAGLVLPPGESAIRQADARLEAGGKQVDAAVAEPWADGSADFRHGSNEKISQAEQGLEYEPHDGGEGDVEGNPNRFGGVEAGEVVVLSPEDVPEDSRGGGGGE
jgi:hypothetical protein